MRKVEAEKAGFAEDGNDLALFAEDRLIGERIGEGKSGAVIILEGAEHFLSGDDLDPGAGFITGEEKGHGDHLPWRSWSKEMRGAGFRLMRITLVS